MPGNRQVRLAARPVGRPTADDWQHVTVERPEPGDGEFLVEIHYLSVDPAMRSWMNDRRSYLPPVRLGEVMRAFALGRVIASRHSGFAEGDYVTGMFGVQEYALSDGRDVITADPARAPLTSYLGALGSTGLTAYFGLIDVGRPRAGDTVVVSGAAGAVGSVVGQIARHLGCRVIVGPRELSVPTREPRLDDRNAGLRLCEPVPGGHVRARGLAAGRHGDRP